MVRVQEASGVLGGNAYGVFGVVALGGGIAYGVQIRNSPHI
jgi:hypothetical protein